MTGSSNTKILEDYTLGETFNHWNKTEKTAFRIAFFYLLLLVLPLADDWYKYIAKVKWSELNCRDLFIISTCRHFDYVKLTSESGRWGLASYINLVIPLGISITAALIWGLFDKKRNNYNLLYYWIHTLARYRVGVGLIAWGYRKLLPGQMVIPTESILNTLFGDFQAQKLYWQGVGVVPGYEVFLGFAEFIPGILLLFRKTSALGAALGAVVLGNIVIANHVYDGSVHVHSAYYTIISLIILWKYLPSIVNLLILKKDVITNYYYPDFKKKWQRYSQLGLKLFVHILFVYIFFGLQVDDYLNAPYRLPDTPGLKGAKGLYEVTEFKLNKKSIPYSPLDSLRWQDAIFESWSTLTFKVNRKSVMDQSNGGSYSNKDIERAWELAGIGGGRRYFYYVDDSVHHVLHLQHKNEKHRKEKLDLRYRRPSANRIILTGTNEFKDSIEVVLDRRRVVYPLFPNGKYEPYEVNPATY